MFSDLRIMGEANLHRLSALIGLSIALTVIFFTVGHIAFESGYNSWLPNHRGIYRVQGTLLLPGLEPQPFPYAPGPAKRAIEKDFSSEISAVVRLYPWKVNVRVHDTSFAGTVHLADDSFFAVFDWPLIAGDREVALRHMNAVVISQKLAHKLFGTADPLGRSILVTDGMRKRNLVVTGILKDWPVNTTDDLKISMLARINESEFSDQRWIFDYWFGLNNLIYVKLNNAEYYETLRSSLEDFVERNVPKSRVGKIGLSLVRLDRIRLWGVSDSVRKANLGKQAVVAFVAFILYAAAAINFMHVHAETAIGERRALGIRIMFGASRIALFLRLLARPVLDAGLALFLLILMVPVGEAWLGPGAAEIRTGDSWGAAWVWTTTGAAAAAMLAALYPLAQLARMRPVAVLPRGGAVIVSGARGIRFALTTAQLFLAMAMLVFTVIVYRQLQFMENMRMGFEDANLVVLHNLDWPEAGRAAGVLKERLVRLAGVGSATLSGTVPPEVGGDLVAVRGANSSFAETIDLRQATIDPDFLPTYGVKILAGRNFDPSRGGDREPDNDEDMRDFSGILNLSAVRQMGFSSPREAVGAVVTIRPGTPRQAHVRIIGVVPDLYVEGAYRPVEPTLYSWQNGSMAYLTIRYAHTDYRRLIKAVETVWRDLLPDVPFEAESLVRRMTAINAPERRRARLLTIYTLLTLFVALMGLFALAFHASRRQLREVGIRKIFGASDRRLLGLLLARLLRPVLWASLLGFPIAWIVARRWLEGFAYRIALGPGPFVEAFVLVLAVAVVTVSGHLVRLVRTRPVTVLREG